MNIKISINVNQTEMKRKMFILLAVLFSASLFVACSSDDKEDPVEVLKEQLKELQGDYGTESNALNLTYNNETLSDKSASFKLTGDFTGVIGLKNVLPGEETTELKVDFTPTTRAEATTFNFEDKDETLERTIEYKGTIKEGAMTLSLKVTMGSEQLVGTYTAGDTPALNLIYGDGLMLGTSASFKLTGDFDGIVTLHNIIPGESDVELEINWAAVRSEGYSIPFEGEDKNTERTISYKGSIEKNEMHLELNVEFASQNVMGKWELNKSTPVDFSWEVSSSDFLVWGTAFFFTQAIKGATSALIPTVLESIELKTNGDVIAQYSDAGAETIVFKPSTPNLAHYYVKDSKIYALLNIDMILAETMKGKTRANSLEDLLVLIQSGIPVDYEVTTSNELKLRVNIFDILDKEFIDTILNEMVVPIIEEILADPEELAKIDAVLGEYGLDLEQIYEGVKLIWPTTTKLEIGLNMTAAQ